MVKPSQEGEFRLHGYEIYFRDSCFFPYTKTLLKVSDHVFEKIRHESRTLIHGRADRESWSHFNIAHRNLTPLASP